MKILVTGCWHIGKTLAGYDWRSDFIDSVQCIIDTSDEVDMMIHLGDLFDFGRPAPKHYALAFEILDSMQCPIFLMKGNHDENPGLEPDALAPLEFVRLRESIRIIRSPEVIGFEGKLFAFLPFQNQFKMRKDSLQNFSNLQECADEFLDQIKSGGFYSKVKGKKYPISLLCTHVDSTVYEFMDSSSTQLVNVVLKKEVLHALPFDVMMGHYHKTAKFDPNVYVPGSILPFDFSEVAEKKNFLIMEV